MDAMEDSSLEQSLSELPGPSSTLTSADSTDPTMDSKGSNEEELEVSPDVDDNDEEDESDDEESDDDEEEVPDDGHPRLIQSVEVARRNSERNPPPKSAALSATKNDDVFAFHSSPESEEPSAKSFSRSGPPPVKIAKTADGEDGPKVQMDEDDEPVDEESKKVPKLIITLSKRKAAVPEDSRSARSSPIATPKCDTTTTPMKKPNRGRKTAASNSARMTRSQLRQAAEEDNGAARRRTRRRGAGSLIGNSLGIDFEDDYSLSPGLGADDDSQDTVYRSVAEKSCERPVVVENPIKGHKEYRGLVAQKWQSDYFVEPETQPEEPEIPEFENFMLNVRDYFLKKDKHRAWVPKAYEYLLPFLQPVFLMQWKRRRDKRIEHEKERTRLCMFGEREFLRSLRKTNTRDRNNVTVMRLLRDDNVNNPVVYDTPRWGPEKPMMKQQSLDEVMEKITYEADKLFNKHYTEATMLQFLQKDELEGVMRLHGFLAPDMELPTETVPCLYAEKIDFSYMLKAKAIADEKAAAEKKDEPVFVMPVFEDIDDDD